MANYVMALDASTTSVCAIIFDRSGKDVAREAEEITQYYPEPGWVEHDPVEIWNKQVAVMTAVLKSSGIPLDEIAAIGITNQRETSVIWDRATGEPIHRAIVWQDRRTSPICDDLRPGIEDYVAENTGLVVDSYFSASKIKWMLDQVPRARERAARGELAFGTIDSWLIWNLTKGARHVTDISNASRTLVYNIRTMEWDDKLLATFDVPRALLPEVLKSADAFGETSPELLGRPVPIRAAVGDQQGALFGQGCYEQRMTKCSYGTSAAIVMNTGDKLFRPGEGLLGTVTAIVDDKVTYAVEGVVFNCGSAVHWLRNELKLISSHDEARVSTEDTNGVYFVPAFNGVFAPVYDPYARGTIVGLTRGAGREHLIRATLESMAFQVHDFIRAIESVTGLPLDELRVDGGSCKNDFVMQFQADISSLPVLRPHVTESAARGAAYLAGLAAGLWESREELADTFGLEKRFTPGMDREKADKRYSGWLRAVNRSLDWAREQD
ncbi:glycerol kinase GlpK [Amorphus orientalis]|uniref:Glycerol kinase n=1 Tax=Amorphus orientalis TaxID=649198 RepID=A0AAE4AS62_9HYPH|nr:glycerol kinase GlpK [Amorphus orientalis]MDQ0315896.1 glycerol kinase [Amorphus orientalis]